MARNVHKSEVSLIKLPIDATREDRGLSICATPQLVVASLESAEYYKNDRTGIAYKFDSMTVELEKDGVTIPAPGVAVAFPYQSDAVGFVIDWRQVTNDGILMQGCYRVVINWELGGNSGSFYYGAFQLREYSVRAVQNTVRLFVVLNDVVREQGINYKDSGFATTVRFKGIFGYMQPNYDTENIIYTDRTRHKVRNEAVRSYELRSNYLLSCMTRQIDENILLAANQIYITDHNAINHVQEYYDFPVILSEDESPSFTYSESVYAKVKAVFKQKVQVSESKYDGNIQGSDNVILSLPTVVSSTEPCAPVDVYVGESNVGSFPSGSDVFVTVMQDGFEVIPEDVVVTGSAIGIVLFDTVPSTPRSTATLMKTGQTTSYRTGDDGDLEAGRATSFLVLAENNPFGNTNRFTDELGGQTYTNNIVIDWSTYDGSTVLGYYKVSQTAATWNKAIDGALSLSVSTFSSGWRLPNRNEVLNICNHGSSSFMFNYSPFNLSPASTVFWTSTTLNGNIGSTTNAYRVERNGNSAFDGKTNTWNWFGVRTFTVTGTTLS